MSFELAFGGVFLLYLTATFLYVLRFFTQKSLYSSFGLGVTFLAAFAQIIVLLAHAFYDENPYATLYLHYFQSSAFLLAFLFIILCFLKRLQVSGLFFLVVIDLLCLLSLVYQSPETMGSLHKGRAYLFIHLGMIFLSLSIFALALISGILFLLAEKQIKAKHFSGWVTKLPSLAVLEEINYKSLAMGFVLFTLAIITGAGYAKITTGHYISANSKQWLSFILWAFFAVFLNFRVKKGWRGQKGILLSIFGLIGMALLFFMGFN